MTQYLLAGRALEIGKEIDSLHDALHAKHDQMKVKFEKEWREFLTAQEAKIQKKMDELGEELGLDKKDGPVNIEGDYLEELGIIIVTQVAEGPETGGAQGIRELMERLSGKGG